MVRLTGTLMMNVKKDVSVTETFGHKRHPNYLIPGARLFLDVALEEDNIQYFDNLYLKRNKYYVYNYGRFKAY